VIATDTHGNCALLEDGVQLRRYPPERVLNRERVDRQITIIRDAQALERADIQNGIVRSYQGRLFANAARSEPGTGPIACPAIIRYANQSDV
jgi:hypothetical protein